MAIPREPFLLPFPQTKKIVGKPFKPGWKGGPGRPKGAMTGYTIEAKEFARKVVSNPVYRRQLKKDLAARTLEPALEQMLWHYAYGKPKESVEHSYNLERLSAQELDQLETLVKRVS